MKIVGLKCGTFFLSTENPLNICTVLFLHYTQLPWEEVKAEMVGEKGLDHSVADKIGEYVKLKGGMELVESLSADEALCENKSAKAALDDMKLLLQFVGLFDITDKVSSTSSDMSLW